MSVLPTTPGLQSTFEDNNDELLHLLTDNWDSPLKDTFINSKWTRDYITRLTSLPLDALLHEPVELRQEQTKAKRDAQQLAFRDYPAFLHAQTCRHQVEETLVGLDVHLAEFLNSVPELQEACQEFSQHAMQIKEERTKITSVLEHQSVLTDLLEIPQLMETCVWNGYYSEAMDLASHVRLLRVRYPLSVIQSIQEQVQTSSDLMLVQLISHLRKPIRLAAAMNVVGFLRRMDVFDTETELRMLFLRCRHDFLQQRLVRVKRDISDDARQKSTDAFEYLKRFIDVMREQMFEIGTQYISIFSNEQGTLLSDYMVHITGLIKSALATYLPMIEDTSALASLLTQLQYCGMSLGRIGLDFRHIFVHSFEEAVQPMILKWIDAATEDLVTLVSKATEEASAPSTWMSSKIASPNSNHTTDSDQARRHAFQPPMLLVGYPSLAIFTNDILSAFNALRLLPAIRLYAPILNHLEACFLDIGLALKQYCDQALSHIPDEITYLQSYTAAYVRCCLPYLKSCLVDGIYGDLSNLETTDEDMEELLAPYLSVINKEETQAEETEDTSVPTSDEKQIDSVIEANAETGSTVEELLKDDETITNEDDPNTKVITEDNENLEEVKSDKASDQEVALEMSKLKTGDAGLSLEVPNPEITGKVAEDVPLCAEEIKEEQPTPELPPSDEQLIRTEETVIDKEMDSSKELSHIEKQDPIDSLEGGSEQVLLETEETKQPAVMNQVENEPVIDTIELGLDAQPDREKALENSSTTLENDNTVVEQPHELEKAKEHANVLINSEQETNNKSEDKEEAKVEDPTPKDNTVAVEENTKPTAADVKPSTSSKKSRKHKGKKGRR
jgi:hypothetical protein